MKKIVKMSLAAAMMMGVSVVSAQADGMDILTNIKADGQIRARYEMVDTNNATPSANAFTNRLSLGVGADLFGTNWLSAYAQMTDVRALNNNYNDAYAGNGTENNNVVKDPEQTRLTQAYIDLKYGKTQLRVGRQAINLDNLRFVGTVDWRQMPQTFDAYTLTNSTIPNLDLFASYVTQVNGVGHDSVTTEIKDTRTILLNASYKVMPELKVTAYDYMIGTGTDGHTSGSDTYGIALSGDVKAGAAKLNYRAEYAKQGNPSMENSGYSNSGIKVDADYINLEIGANINGILAGIQYEVLSGKGSASETAFQTPLATLHAHNGWADMFLTTPTKGLEDLSASLGYTAAGFGTLKAIYHDYTSEVDSINYGTELDVVYTRPCGLVKNLTATLKYADYRAGDTVAEGNYAAQAVDTTKFWAMLDYKFATK